MALGLRLRTPFAQVIKNLHIPSTRNNVPVVISGRSFSSGTAGRSFGKGSGKLYTAIIAAGVGSGYYLWTREGESARAETEAKQYRFCAKYQRVYNSIAQALADSEYEDGNYAPIFLRLAWQASGTYCFLMNNGGSYKATMRFEPESCYEANSGLHLARCKLEGIKEKYPWVTYGDLWTLAGICAVQEMGGPTIPWRPGRLDGTPDDYVPDGRLPMGQNGTARHSREIFYRMGFDDQEIVALVGAHSVGRCHADRSGFEGQWTTTPTCFSNKFFQELLNRQWVEKKWNGPKQFEDENGELMMLPTDMAFLDDCKFKKWVQKYAQDEKRFFQDFAKAYQKLLELGVPFPKGKPEFVFKTLAESDDYLK